MRNSVLHLLTNQAADFVSPIFPNVSDYTPHEESTVEKSLRSFLKLGAGNPDYYLVSLLSSVYSFPEVLEEFKETDKTFDLSDYTRPHDYITGGTLINSDKHQVKIARSPSEYPVAMEIVIEYKDEKEVFITTGTLIYAAKFNKIDDNNLEVKWPSDIGLSGVLSPTGGVWESGSRVTIFHQPITYPFAQVASRILKRSDFITYLSEVGLLKHVYSSQSGLEQMALVCLALANPKRYAQ